jgi:hypothetical protein
MRDITFTIPVDIIGEFMQRIVNAEKAIDPYNDSGSSVLLTLPDSFDGPATIVWRTGQYLMAMEMLSLSRCGIFIQGWREVGK